MKRLWKTMAMVGLLAGLAAGMCPAAEMGQDRAVSGEGLQKGEIVYTDGVAIGNVTAHQRFPWNGLVDIDYEVLCEDPDTEIWVVPEATDGEHGVPLVMETLSGDGATGRIKAGKHRMMWDAKADNPGAHSIALTLKMKGAKPDAQTISFEDIGNPTWQDRVELSATATSGLAVTFEVLSGPGMVEENVLTFTGEGTVEVRAVQAGNDRWLPASATQTVTVKKVVQTIAFATIGAQLTTNRVELSATATSGLAVTFEVLSGPGVVEENVLTFTGEGTVEVRAVQAGNDRWLPATATQTVEVAKVAQTISFTSIGAQVTTNRVELSATATSGLAVTFEVVSGPGVIEGNVLAFTGEGTVEVRAVQAGDERWLPATATQTVTVAKAAQTIFFAAIGEQLPTNRVELSAMATSGLAVTFEVVSGPGVIDGNVLTFTGAGTVEVRAVQAGDERWLAASATQTVEVGKQTIAFPAIGEQLPTNRVELSATATSGLSVTFEVVSGPGVVTGNVLTFTGEGTVEVRAVQAGDDLWLPAAATQTVTVFDASKLYMVVDLSAGSGTEAVYPVSYLSAEPEGGWSDEYKTTKLVLRRIVPGTFMMGSTIGYYDNPLHQVTLTKPYYMGVFEVTQKQYELVTGGKSSYFANAACYEKRPVEQVSWNTIRGNSGTYDWPNSAAVDANSFMGRLRARTGLVFDLPTEAQWEYACRAGTTTDFNSGKNLTNHSGLQDSAMDEVGRYWYNGGQNGSSSCDTSAGTAEVGSYLPNAWGLYDMHGNVIEWCLDWYGSLADGATDPVGSSSGSNRVERGGCWNDYASSCASSDRGYTYPSGSNLYYGFRLVRTLSN